MYAASVLSFPLFKYDVAFLFGEGAIKQLLKTEPYEAYSCENGILMKRVGDKNIIILPLSMHRLFEERMKTATSLRRR